MPLTLLNIGQRAVVLKLSGNDTIKNHLNNLGFVEGKEVSLKSFDGTNYIIIIENSKYALNKDLAKRIFVKEIWWQR